MLEAGVREIKDRLSEYLRKVKAGEEVVITEHGRPVAKLSGIAKKPTWPAWVEAMVARGELIPGTGETPRGSGIQLRGPGPTVSDIIIQHRQERHDSLVGLIGAGQNLSRRARVGDGPRTGSEGSDGGSILYCVPGGASRPRRRVTPAKNRHAAAGGRVPGTR